MPSLVIVVGALKTPEWKTREWTSRHEEAVVDNAGVENVARRCKGGKRGSGEAVSSDQTRWQLSRLTDNNYE